MGSYIWKRVLTFIPILLIMSLVIFFIISFPLAITSRPTWPG